MACSASSDDKRQEVDVVRSSLARDTAPALSPLQLDTFSQDQAEFAVDLYQAVQKTHPGKDVVLSPHSISTALAMTFAGARAETREEMKKTLHYGLEDADLHRAFDYLDLALSSRGQGAVATDGKPFRLAVTNSIWGQKGLAFAAPFLDTIAVNYGAGLNVVDFKSPCANERVGRRGAISWADGGRRW
jgi:serpin B